MFNQNFKWDGVKGKEIPGEFSRMGGGTEQAVCLVCSRNRKGTHCAWERREKEDCSRKCGEKNIAGLYHPQHKYLFWYDLEGSLRCGCFMKNKGSHCFRERGWWKVVLIHAAAKSLQSCLTLCDSIDSSPPGSAVPGILQARILEWVAISFSNAWKWKVKAKLLSHVRPSATPWTAAYQAPPSMGFSRQEYWSGVPLPSPSLKNIPIQK